MKGLSLIKSHSPALNCWDSKEPEGLTRLGASRGRDGFSLLRPQGGWQAAGGILIRTSQSWLSLAGLLGDLVWKNGAREGKKSFLLSPGTLSGDSDTQAHNNPSHLSGV